MTAQYALKGYWDERYTRDHEPFEWFQRYDGIKPIVGKHARKESNILIVGCGNSRMTEEMHADGFVNLTNIDFSSIVIKQMRERCKDLAGVSFQEMDATNMSFADSQFDVVIDKATLDCILCAENAQKLTESMMKNVHRVLRPNGVFICVSYGAEDQRMSYFDPKMFAVEHISIKKPPISDEPVPDDEVHHVYVCKRLDHQ